MAVTWAHGSNSGGGDKQWDFESILRWSQQDLLMDWDLGWVRSQGGSGALKV